MYTLVPQFIIEKYARQENNGHFYAATLFVDISGFSALTDQLMMQGQHGAEVLAGIMAETFEPLIDAVYRQGGFIAGFAGDAFTAIFPDTTVSPADRALAAAVAIQEEMQARPEQEKPDGRITVAAKVGMAAGDVIWGIVTSGDKRRASYYFQGPAIDACAEAEHNARPGEIILDAGIYEALRAVVAVAGVDRHYRVTSVTGPVPAPQPYPRSSIQWEQAPSFVPHEVVRAGRRGEFRQVVNMFISLPTVRTAAQLDIFMQIVFDLQERYGGILNRLGYGDKGAQLLLFWGAPVAHENDIQRALNFVLELQIRTAIPLRGGVTYRVAHAGYIGSSLRGEYTCHGRGVNLAARFMTSAPRGEIWIDEQIARRAGGQFDIEFVGEKQFKGFADLQKVYALFERIEVADDFYDGRLVGRDAELARLKEFVAPLYEGHSPGMLVVWGEPGVGKSRLAHEFLAHHLPDDEQTQVFLARADEILRQSLNPFRYWLRRYFGQSEALAESRNKRGFNRKLDQLIAETEAQQVANELDRERSFLGALVGLYWADSLYEQVDAKGRLEHTLAALSALLKAESCRRPAILLLEDTQWLDQESSAFLSELLRDLAGSEKGSFPLALLVTVRDEGGKRLPEGTPFHELRLSSLGAADLEALAEAHLDAPPAQELFDLLVEQSEGNPFFAEQILQFLRESEQVSKVEGRWRLAAGDKSPLPRDVNALLVARLDRLAHAVRDVVQTAAVLGREFEVRVLSAMIQGDDNLPGKIAKAEEESIWFALNQMRYIFKHVLLRDAAYRMQLRARRQALHKLALEALESVFKEDLSGRSGELAYHALGAGLTEPAFRYSLLAGNLAMRQYAAAEAVDHYRPAMERIRQVESSGEERRQLCVLYGRALELIGDPAAALAHYEQMEQLAQELGDKELELAAVVAQGTIRSTGNVMGDFELGEALNQKGLELAISLNDSVAQATIHWNLMQAYRLTGQYEESLANGQRGLELAEASNLREQMAHIANDLVTLYIGLGELSRGLATCRRAAAAWRELENWPMLVDSLATYGMLKAMTGQFDEALDIAQEGIALSQASNNLWGEAFMRYTPALVHLQRMEVEDGLAHTDASLRLAREGGAAIVELYMGLFQSLLYLAAKNYDQALESARQAASIASRHLPFQKRAALGAMAIAHIERGQLEEAGELVDSYQINPDRLGWLLVLLPELAVCRHFLAQGDYGKLLPLIERVIASAEAQDFSLMLPQFYIIQAQAFLALRKWEAARASVQSGLSLLERTSARWGFLELAGLLTELEEQAGNDDCTVGDS